VIRWIARVIAAIFETVSETPGAGRIVQFTLYGLVAILVVVLGYRLFRHYQATRGHAPNRFNTDDVTNLWKDAERAAAAGDYTAAAHLLYAALIRMLVLRGVLRFHPSKTSGDYVRELRRGDSGILLTPFVDFVRAYEVVVYRDGTCDAPRYAMLRALGDPIVRPRRAAA